MPGPTIDQQLSVQDAMRNYLDDVTGPSRGAADLDVVALLQMCLHLERFDDRTDAERHALMTALCISAG